jgi:hypothetical protein
VMHMRTPVGKSAVANKFVPDCEIKVGRQMLKANLIMMPIEDYDLILRMDWLSKHSA